MTSVPRLFVDKFVVTLSMDRSVSAEISEAIIDSSEAWAGVVSQESPIKSGYREHFQIEVPNGKRASIFLDPFNSSHGFFRLEYSPYSLERDGLVLLGEYLREVLGDGYLDQLLDGRLSRLDLAFDVRRYQLKDFLIFDSQQRKSLIFRGEDSEFETYYYPPNGANQLCIYNKLKELTDRLGSPPPNRRPASWVRFEYRYTRMCRYTLRNIVGRLENPFSNFHVQRYAPAEGSLSPDVQLLFFRACQAHGVDTVLDDIEDAVLREELSRIYEGFPVPQFWRRRTAIWAGLRSAIDAALPA